MLNNSGGPVLRSPGERLTILIEGPNFHFLGSGNFGRIAVHRAAAFAVNHEFRVENFEVRIDKIFARDGLHVALADRFWAPAGNLSLGDLNGDGSVDAADLADMLNSWGSGGPADLNGDGSVDASDMSILLGNFGL